MFEFASADLALGSVDGSSLLWSKLVSLTPLQVDSWITASAYAIRRRELVTALDNLGELAKATVRPKFVVAHILAPHPPFVFGPNGEERRPRGPYSFSDGSHFVDQQGAEAYRTGYTEQITYLNKLILKSLDAMLANAKSDAVIVLQGDHGSKLKLNQDDLAKTDLEEALPILMAVRAPFSKEVPQDLTPVNLFRLVLSQLFGDPLPPLPQKSFYSTWERPFTYTDVTGQGRK
jgi:hypothetical protein